MIGGVRVGRVADIKLDDFFTAVVDVQIDTRFDEIPIDSFVSIRTMGLLGEQFISIDAQAGGLEDDVWRDGASIHLRYTQSAISLDELIGQAIFQGGES